MTDKEQDISDRADAIFDRIIKAHRDATPKWPSALEEACIRIARLERAIDGVLNYERCGADCDWRDWDEKFEALREAQGKT